MAQESSDVPKHPLWYIFAVLGYYFAKNSAPVYVTRLLFGVVKEFVNAGINLAISLITYDEYLHEPTINVPGTEK